MNMIIDEQLNNSPIPTQLHNAEVECNDLCEELIFTVELITKYGDISLKEVKTKIVERLDEIWRDFPELEPKIDTTITKIL